MFTGTEAEYRKACAKSADLGAQVGDLLRQIEALDVGIVTVRGPQIIGPNFILRRTGESWIFTS